MKTILATGAAGFIGSNLVRYLLEKYKSYRIIILDALTYAGSMENIPRDPRVQFCYGNVTNAELVNKLVAESDVVIHLAAESHVTRSIFDNLQFFQTDVIGTQAIANAVAEHGKHIERFIHISTSEVYGSAMGDYMAEDDILMPASPYAAAKAGADRLVYSYFNTYGIPAIIIRPFNQFGEMQHLEKLIPRFITSCILNEPLNIHGDGSASRDWLYVHDTCEAIDKALHCDLDKVKGQVINIGSGRSIDIITIARMIIEKMGRSEKLINYIEDRPGQVSRHTANVKRARELLNWQSTTKFEDGLGRTIEWYQQNVQWWERQVWMRSITITTKDGKKVIH